MYRLSYQGSTPALRNLTAATAALSALALSTSTASANVMYWMNAGGNWNTTNTNWRDGATNGSLKQWSSGSEAVFAGAGGTVNLAMDTSVKQLRFDTGGYTIVGSGSNRTLTLSKDQGSGWVSFRVATTDNQPVTLGSATSGQAVNINGESNSETHTFHIDAGDTANVVSSLANMRFVKSGTGLLRLSGSNSSYTGTTSIAAGTLLVNGTHVHASSGEYSFATSSSSGHATLGGTGTIIRSVAATGTNSSNQAVIAPGDPATPNGVGTLTIGSSGNTKTLTFNNNSRLSIDIDGGNADKLVVNGGLALSSGNSHELDFNIVNAPTLGKYTIASYTGQRTGASSGFSAVTDLPTGYRLSYSSFTPTNGGTIDLIQRAVLAPTAGNATVSTGGSVAIPVSSRTAPRPAATRSRSSPPPGSDRA